MFFFSFFFRFFCQPCPGIVNWYSWFWKSLNMMNWGSEFSFFYGIHIGIGIRIDISISINTRFDKQVHLEELTEMRQIKLMCLFAYDVIMSKSCDNKKHYISTTIVFMATKLGRITTYLDGVPSIKTHNLWSHDLVTSRDKFKLLYLQYHSPYGYQAWQCGEKKGWWLTFRGSYP